MGLHGCEKCTHIDSYYRKCVYHIERVENIKELHSYAIIMKVNLGEENMKDSRVYII